MGLNNISLEGDAKLVVDTINSGESNWTRISHLVELRSPPIGEKLDILQLLIVVLHFKSNGL
jgi:hypothetical protein